MTINLDTVKELLTIGLNAQEIGDLLGVHSRTIKRAARRLGIPLKAGHPAEGERLGRSDKVQVFELFEQGHSLANIARSTGFQARSILRFIEEIWTRDWGRSTCLQCDTIFITHMHRENRICLSCKGKNIKSNWLEDNAQCLISLPERNG